MPKYPQIYTYIYFYFLDLEWKPGLPNIANVSLCLPAIHIHNESEITFDSMILYQIRIECVLGKYIHLNWILGSKTSYILNNTYME